MYQKGFGLYFSIGLTGYVGECHPIIHQINERETHEGCCLGTPIFDNAIDPLQVQPRLSH